ncbi:zinc metalloprotease [Scheffersomyces xylosifermentans]|uniref:zinc metalloprotease n=1 Tax=Scheffersomyces xylosifermentans TaxID=1304137 RepID=UPI00315D13D8
MISLADSFAFLDNPSINWKYVTASLAVGKYLFESYVEYRQYKLYKKPFPPPSLKGKLTQETFDKSQAYSTAKSQLSFASRTLQLLQSLAYIKYDFLSVIWNQSGAILAKTTFLFPGFIRGVISQSIVFFAATQIISTVLSAPSSYYENFAVEDKYGFNKMSVATWISDILKEFTISFLLQAPFLALFLKLIDYYGDASLACGMILATFLQCLNLTLLPSVILPWFYTFTPLKDGKLKEAVETLAKKHKVPLEEIFVVDTSSRTAHSNAYLIGLPWSQKIVLYDNLIETSTIDEIVAILTHEIGHWKSNDTLKLLAASEATLFIMFSFFSAFIYNKSLYSSFGFNREHPTIIGFFLFYGIYGELQPVITFFIHSVAQNIEYRADYYAKSYGYGQVLGEALIKLEIQSLTAFHNDWLYSAYRHSHPTLVQRLASLDYVSDHKVPTDSKEIKKD